MPIDLSILGGIALPQVRDPQQEAIQRLNMQTAQLQQQQMAMNLQKQQKSDKDLELMDQVMSQLPKDQFGNIDLEQAQSMVPGHLRSTVAQGVTAIQAAKNSIETTKQNLVKDMAVGVYQAKGDPKAQIDLFLGKLAAMRDAKLVSDDDAKMIMRQVSRPSMPLAGMFGQDTGGINADALNAALVGLMGPERFKQIQDAEAKNAVVVGNSLVDKNTGKVLYQEPRPEPKAPAPTQATIESNVLDAMQRLRSGNSKPGDKALVDSFTQLQNIKRPPSAGPAPEKLKSVVSGDAARISDFNSAVEMAEDLFKSMGKGGSTTKFLSWLPTPIANQVGELSGSARARKAQIELAKVILAKSLEKGVLTDADLERYAYMIPEIGESEEVAKSKMDLVLGFSKKRRQNFLDSLSDSGYDISKHIKRIAEKESAEKELNVPRINLNGEIIR